MNANCHVLKLHCILFFNISDREKTLLKVVWNKISVFLFYYLILSFFGWWFQLIIEKKKNMMQLNPKSILIRSHFVFHWRHAFQQTMFIFYFYFSILVSLNMIGIWIELQLFYAKSTYNYMIRLIPKAYDKINCKWKY